MTLARYNLIGKATIAVVLLGGLGAPLVVAAIVVFGSTDTYPIAVGVAIMWLFTLPGLRAALRGFSSLISHEGRCVYVDDDELVYVAPGQLGSLTLRATDIVLARATTRQRTSSGRSSQTRPVSVVEITRPKGKAKDLAAFAMDVPAHALAEKINEFAAGRAQRGYGRSIVE